MPKLIESQSLTTVRLAGNLSCHIGRHPDGLPLVLEPITQAYSASWVAEKLTTPRWGLDYVITTIGPSWDIGTGNKTIIQERGFLPGINARVSIPSVR